MIDILRLKYSYTKDEWILYNHDSVETCIIIFSKALFDFYVNLLYLFIEKTLTHWELINII